MPIETIEHLGNKYPRFQASGNAARFVKEFAKEVCKGVGVDVGCNRREWCLEGAIPVDPLINNWNAYDLPTHWNFNPEIPLFERVENGDLVAVAGGEVNIELFDYCFSSHVCEHLPNWVTALDYWHSRLKVGGVVFLYLPDHSQTYWRSHFNRKHIHNLTPEIVGDYFKDQPNMWTNVFVSGVDLNNSFVVMAEKI